MAIEVCDYARSCIRFQLDTTIRQPITVSHKPPFTVNNLRIPLECRTTITDLQSGKAVEYVLGASCKTERVWVLKDVWVEPNADFCVVASIDQFMNIKRWDKVDKGVMRYPESLGVQPERQVGNPSDAYNQFSIEICACPARLIEATEQSIRAFGSNSIVVSTTEYATPSHRVLIEYPVKTVNYSEQDGFYQVDTGPVLLPDLAEDRVPEIEDLRLAFVAHNAPDWAEFIMNVPTALNDTIAVHHYSKPMRVDARNALLEIK